MNENILIHRFFGLGIFLKGIFALLEVASGVLLFFVTSDSLLNSVYHILGHELTQDPTDIFANFLLNLFSNFPNSLKIFFAAYLLIHGIVKLGLIFALWKEKLWAYPLSGAIFLMFMIYQFYRYLHHHSVYSLFLIFLDLLVIILIYLEYQNLKKFKFPPLSFSNIMFK